MSDARETARAARQASFALAASPAQVRNGALLAVAIRTILPFLLSLAAGAMIAVVVSELIPESQLSSRRSAMTLATLLGFTVMMVLDVALS